MANERPAMSPEKQRWIQVMLFSYIIVVGSWLLAPKPPQPGTTATGTSGAGTTTGTLTTSTSGQIIAEASSLDNPSAGARAVEGATSVSIASHPGTPVSLTTKNYALDIDTVGAVVNSWRLL